MTTENKRVDTSVSVKTLGVVKNFGVAPARTPAPQSAQQPKQDNKK